MLDNLVTDLLGEAQGLSPAQMDKALAGHQKGTGPRIVNNQHPEWGSWAVTNKTTHDGATWWDIRGRRGSRTLSSGELRHWRWAAKTEAVTREEELSLQEDFHQLVYGKTQVQSLNEAAGEPSEYEDDALDDFKNLPKKSRRDLEDAFAMMFATHGVENPLKPGKNVSRTKRFLGMMSQQTLRALRAALAKKKRRPGGVSPRLFDDWIDVISDHIKEVPVSKSQTAFRFEEFEHDMGLLRDLLSEFGAVTEASYAEGPDGSIYVDTAFMNALNGVLPGYHMSHMGFGEFELKGPEGNIQFDRMRGKDFPGQSGRSHKLYGPKGPVERLMRAMKGKAKKVQMEETDLSEAAGNMVAILTNAEKVLDKTASALHKHITAKDLPIAGKGAEVEDWKRAMRQATYDLDNYADLYRNYINRGLSLPRPKKLGLKTQATHDWVGIRRVVSWADKADPESRKIGQPAVDAIKKVMAALNREKSKLMKLTEDDDGHLDGFASDLLSEAGGSKGTKAGRAYAGQTRGHWGKKEKKDAVNKKVRQGEKKEIEKRMVGEALDALATDLVEGLSPKMKAYNLFMSGGMIAMDRQYKERVEKAAKEAGMSLRQLAEFSFEHRLKSLLQGRFPMTGVKKDMKAEVADVYKTARAWGMVPVAEKVARKLQAKRDSKKESIEGPPGSRLHEMVVGQRQHGAVFDEANLFEAVMDTAFLPVGERERDLMEASKLTYDDPQLGVLMHHWHWGMGDPVYRVGSMIYAGKPVAKSEVQDAIDNLEDSLDDARGPDKRELERIIDELSMGMMEAVGDPAAKLVEAAKKGQRPPGTVGNFLILLTSKITQQDMRAQRRAAKRGGYFNPHALPLMLGQIEKIRKGMGPGKERSQDPEDLKKLKALIKRHYTPGTSPAEYTMKAIDKVLAGQPFPKITGKAGTRPMWN